MTVFKTSVRNFFAHKGRMALSGIAVLLSVAFICGTLVFTDTMTATFDKLFGSTASDVTVSAKEVKHEQATGIPDTVPASLQSTLSHVSGVVSSVPDITSQDVTVADAHNNKISPSSGAPTIVSNWDSTETKAVKLTSGHLPTAGTQAVVDADTAKAKHLKIGDTLRVIAQPGDFRVTLTGIVTFKSTNPGAAVVYVDTATAQSRLLGRTDAYTGYGLTAAKGVTDDQLKAHVKAAIGGHYTIDTAKEETKKQKDDLGGFLNFMKYAMLGFAGIAVLVGIFLIVNTFSMLVAQRTREIGLMRALGSSRRQVNRSVLIEAVMLGISGSVLGIGGGIGLAIGLMKLMGKAGLKLDSSELTIKATTPVVGLVIGVVVTVVSAYIPARRAGRISPMAALRDAGTPADVRAGRIRAAIGVLVCAAGVFALIGASQTDKASSGGGLLGIGVLLTLVGFVIVGPLLAGVVVRAVSAVILRFFGPMGRLAERNALRNPRRTGATASALMIGLALVAGMSVVGSSLVASASDQLDKSVGADFIIEVGSNASQPITPAANRAIKSAGGLDHFTDYTIINATITTPSGKQIKDQISAADSSYTQDVRLDTTQGRLADAYGKNAMSVPENFAKDNHVKVGDVMTVALVGGRTAHLKIAAVTKNDSALENGTLFTSIDTARAYLPPDKMPGDFLVFAKAADGKQKEAYASLKAKAHDYPQIDVRDQADYKDLIQNQVNQLLYLIYALLALAIIVAVLGVINTLALSVVERTREIGLMRAIGTSRRQMRRMIRLESVVISLFGAIVGLGLGLGWGTTAQKVLASQGLEVLRIPWSTIVIVFVASAVVGLLAALLPAFRAARMNVLNAIATD
ncbi:putative ABC transport system permease protein [Actinacidiphila yanglinensis]|uniref:Putative ABC transport system permease protein n=1 Tax=Actinacidiphila yanglinensis TaxID=310779 RepID=A0A1H5ZK30_9ACTN|nr:ABC transporter permease [Actinacidiphila yanglinensis]SEG36007.1 putative ABC transport system permease protein [Actinacidiphila yanglinensis]